MCCSSLTTSSGSHRLVLRCAKGFAFDSNMLLSFESILADFTDGAVDSQVSALLGRIPSAVGYQPTLATDMGTMQERITTTKKGSITSVQVTGI